MKNSILSILLVISISFVNSCAKEKTCAGFSVNDLSEFCYRENGSITFETIDNKVFELYISEIVLSSPYSFECRDLYNVCPCTDYVEAIATDSKTSVPYSFLKMEQSDVSAMQYFKYNLLNFSFEFDFINELPYIDQMDQFKYIGSITIGDIVYSDVIEVANLDFSTSTISKVYFNKPKGLLRFIEKTTGEVWSIKAN